MARKQERKPRERERLDDQPGNSHLGRILIGFIVLAAILWILSFIF